MQQINSGYCYWILHVSYFSLVFCTGQKEVPSTNQTNNLQLTSNTTTFSAGVDDYYSYEKVNVNNVSCQGKVCVRKCCEANFVFDTSNQKCVVNSSSTHTNHSVLTNGLMAPIDNTKLLILYGFPPELENKSTCYVHTNGFSLKPDGNVFHKFREEIFSHQFYCIDEKLENDDGEPLMGLLCYDLKAVSRSTIIVAKIRLAGLSISCISLTVILVLYFLSKNRKSLLSKCLISMSISFLLSFLLQIIKTTPIVQNITDDACFAMASLLHFFSHSFHFWLNIMCYEISRVIRGTINADSQFNLEGTNHRYLCYAIYSWGVPILTTVLLWGMIYLPKDLSTNIEPYIIRPDIQLNGCWFKEAGVSYFLYHGAIEIFLQILNTLIMGHVALLLNWDKCISLRSKKKSLLPMDSNSNYRKMFWQQLCIFMVFVFIWSLDYFALVNSRNKYWGIVHVIIAFQGAYLLVIVVMSNRCSLLSDAKETLLTFTQMLSKKNQVEKNLPSKIGSSSSIRETAETNV